MAASASDVAVFFTKKVRTPPVTVIADFSDDFDAGVGANWSQQGAHACSPSAGAVVNSLDVNATANQTCAIVYTQPTTGIDQWCLVQATNINSGSIGCLFRGAASSAVDNHYQVYPTGIGEIRWSNYVGSAAGFSNHIFQGSNLTGWSNNDWFGARITGSTAVDMEVCWWHFDGTTPPSGGPSAWGTETGCAPHDGTSAVYNTGKFIGARSFRSGTNNNTFDNWSGGDVVEQPVLNVSPLTLSPFTPSLTDASPLNVTVTNPGVGSVAWTCTTGASWLQCGLSSGTTLSSGSTIVPINFVGSGALAIGQYIATVTFSCVDCGGSPQVVTVTLNVTSNTPSLDCVALDSLSRTAFSGTQDAGSTTIRCTNGGGGSLDWSAPDPVASCTGGGDWLQVSPTDGANLSQGQSVDIVVGRTGSSACSNGTYNQNVTINCVEPCDGNPDIFNIEVVVATQAAGCTDGVSCYCDRIKNPSDPLYAPNYLFCEDFEAPSLYEWVPNGTGAPNYGNWVDGSFSGSVWDRGSNSYWTKVLGNTVSSCSWSRFEPSNPRIGTQCGDTNNCNGAEEYVSGAQGVIIDQGFNFCNGTESDCRNAWGGNSQACIDIQRAGDHNDEISSLTLNTTSIPWIGKQYLAHRIPTFSTAGIGGLKFFNCDVNGCTEVGVTQWAGYGSRTGIGGATRSAMNAPWKHEEYGPNIQFWTHGNTGAGGPDSHDPENPYRPFFWTDGRRCQNNLLTSCSCPPSVFFTQDCTGVAACGGGTCLASANACQQFVNTATVTRGQTECSATGFGFGADPAFYNQPTDWPFGTWACSKAHVKGLGTTNMELRLWHNDLLIFEMTGFDSRHLKDAKLDRFMWDSYANENIDPPNTSETSFRYQDNFLINEGPPVDCFPAVP